MKDDDRMTMKKTFCRFGWFWISRVPVSIMLLAEKYMDIGEEAHVGTGEALEFVPGYALPPIWIVVVIVVVGKFSLSSG